ncbi:carrier protein [Angomonas deanei]|uniref:Mitochondrial carrier protein, putative n=1 Tax=Angomonas deanei TaxID=59799 RepID=A0A7G2CUJ3_9TRYP|nr:carrier protein [Angomonas deanei]CAD2222604.1 Mitochondrial carrier protein, putative [Angomonas deanei]|eukprot:EPY39614.1 carrier protein [Angomonas deanei]
MISSIESTLLDDAVKPHEHTNSINRSYSDLSQPHFMFYAMVLCAARTAAQQPINLALARKQTCWTSNCQSTFAVLRNVFQQEGRWRGLSKGMLAMTAGCALSEVIYLSLFEFGRERLRLSSEAARDASAAYLADAVSRTVYVPLTIISFRQMASRGSVNPSMWRVSQQMYSERGWRTVFAGYGTTIVVGCQWTAVWWAVYAQLKHVLYESTGPLLAHPSLAFLPEGLRSSSDNLALNSIASVVTSASTAALFNPYMVVRTNLQVVERATVWSVTSQLYRARGVAAFFSGLKLNMCACVLDGFLASTCYEYAKLWADRSHRRDDTTAAPREMEEEMLQTI